MTLLHTQRERELVADALGDTPETVIAVHHLRRGLADAYVVGAAPPYPAVIVRRHLLPQEPECFGSDPSVIWRLLRPLHAWDRQGLSPSVEPGVAHPLAALMERDVGVRIEHCADVYHTLTGRVHTFFHPAVRLLSPEDAGILARYRTDPRSVGFASFHDFLVEGVAAGALVEGALVALASTPALTARYGDIGVATDEDWRVLGFASAAASIVAQELQARGSVPVWSAAETNAASLRVAAKLGFAEVSRRVYLNTRPPNSPGRDAPRARTDTHRGEHHA